MITKLGNVSTRVLLFAMSASCATALSVAAWAAPPPSPPPSGQTIEGCDQKVLDAAQAKARALVVFDKAMVAERVDKPDSQLALNCFNNIAGVAENEGGTLFSGPLNGHWWAAGVTYPYNRSSPPVWTADTYYSDDIEDALNSFYGDFADADGNDGGTVDYTATTVTDSPSCSQQTQLWGQPVGGGGGPPVPIKQGDVRGEGERGGVPFPDDNALSNVAPLANQGVRYQEAITTDTPDLTDVKTTSDLLAPAGIKPVVPVFPANPIVAGGDNACQVLITAGVTAVCP